jgi:hypothetical protein
MNFLRPFGTIPGQHDPLGPGDGGHGVSETAPHEKAELLGHDSMTLFGNGLGRVDQALGQFR